MSFSENSKKKPMSVEDILLKSMEIKMKDLSSQLDDLSSQFDGLQKLYMQLYQKRFHFEGRVEKIGHAAAIPPTNHEVVQHAPSFQPVRIQPVRTIYSGTICFKAERFVFICFPTEKDEAHRALFIVMSDWFKAQKALGKKNSRSQNLISYKEYNNSEVFDSLNLGDNIFFYVKTKIDVDGLKKCYAFDIIHLSK